MLARAWWLVIGLCLLLASGLGLYKGLQIRAGIALMESRPEPAEAVQAGRARQLVWQPTVDVTGEVVAVLDVELTNELPGRIVALGFEPGAKVRSGQLLVELDTREETAQLKAARAEARLAGLALDRNRRLASSGAASEEARDRATAQRASALSRVEQLQAIIDKKTLRAPFNAVAGLHQLAVGQYLEAGTVLTRLVGSEAGNWVDFSLPQHQANLKLNDEVTLLAPRLFDQPLTAKVIARDAWVDQRSRHLRYRARPSAGHPSAGHPVLTPGAMVTVNVPTGAPLQATGVPPTALRRDAYGSHVFVLEPDPGDNGERARRRAVMVAGESPEQTVIRSGLAPGERIAVDGAFKLREGALVQAMTAEGDNPQ